MAHEPAGTMWPQQDTRGQRESFKAVSSLEKP